MLCYVVVCYVMLYYLRLYFITLYYIILYYIILYYIILYYIILYYIILYYIILYLKNFLSVRSRAPHILHREVIDILAPYWSEDSGEITAPWLAARSHALSVFLSHLNNIK